MEKKIVFGGPQSVNKNNPQKETVNYGGVLFLSDPSLVRQQLVPSGQGQVGNLVSEVSLFPGASTDHIIRVADLLTDSLEIIGLRALLGMGDEYGFKEGSLKASSRTVLVAGERFGSGSSREQAVWALLKSNIAAVIARSFGPVFLNNAVNLGILTSTDFSLIERINNGEPVDLEEFLKDKNSLQREIILSGGLFRYLDEIRSGKKEEPKIEKEARTVGGMNIIEKRLAKVLQAEQITEGDVALVPVDELYSYDILSSLARAVMLDQYGKPVSRIDPSKIRLFEDHFAHSSRSQVPALMQGQRLFARELGIPSENYFYGKRADSGGLGICHRIMMEKIDPRKSQVIVATDSHTPTIGVLPIIPIPVGSTLFTAALAEGKIPFSVPKVCRIELSGKLPPGFSIRDLQLELAVLAKSQKLAPGLTVEFGGEGLNGLSFDSVTALCNMVPEILNAETAVTEAFEAGINYLQNTWGISRKEAEELYGKPDQDARYESVLKLDLSTVVPWIARPGDPTDSVKLAELDNCPKIDKAYLVSCTLGYDDLVQAAAVLKDKKVAEGTKLIVVPGSQRILEKAREQGVIQILVDAGAIVTDESACGPCIGEGLFPTEDRETAITASNRNFKGRMGSKKADVFLAGPILTAMSAVLGKIPTIEEYQKMLPDIVKNLSET